MRRTDLPQMPQCTSCGMCCGPVGARPDEAKRIKKYLKETGESWTPPPPGEDPGVCGFLRPNGDGSFGCAVYEVRPWSCRAFGVIKEMTCPFFPEAATLEMPRRQAVNLHFVDEDPKLLGEYFEATYLQRIGGRRGNTLKEWLKTAARGQPDQGKSGDGGTRDE